MTAIFRAGNGMWASKISIVSPESGAVLHSVELEQNQGIHSICLTKFQSVGMIDWYLLAGTSNSMILNPRHSQGKLKLEFFYCRGSWSHCTMNHGDLIEIARFRLISEAPSITFFWSDVWHKTSVYKSPESPLSNNTKIFNFEP